MPGRFLNRFLAQALLAFFIFAGSSLLAVAAYARLLEQEKPGDSRLLSLKSGQQDINITSHGRCAGTLRTRLEHGKGTSCTVDGRLDSLWQGKVITSQLKAAFNFNPLGQLNDGQLSFKIEENELHVSISEVNPVRLAIQGITAGKTFDYQLALPGPLTLVKAENDTYVLQRKSVNSLPLSENLPILENLRSQLALVIEAAGTEKPACSEDNLQALDLSPIAALAMQLYQQSPLK